LPFYTHTNVHMYFTYITTKEDYRGPGP